jgi:hypothetical protein
MNCVACGKSVVALFPGDTCEQCSKAFPVSHEQPQTRAEAPQPRAFAEVTPELRLAHVGNWMAFYVAGLRMESPINPGLSARRAANMADAALGRLLKCIPQLARPTEEPINPIQQ